MQEEISINDLDRSHRLEKKHSSSRPLPMIIKFAKYNVCNKIFRNKNILKGKNISITNNVTNKRTIEIKDL